MRRAVLPLVVAVVIATGAFAAWRLTGDRERGAPRGPVSAKGDIVELLWDLQIVPLEGKTPPPFRLERLGGGQLALGDLQGRPALLYFWASW